MTGQSDRNLKILSSQTVFVMHLLFIAHHISGNKAADPSQKAVRDDKIFSAS